MKDSVANFKTITPSRNVILLIVNSCLASVLALIAPVFIAAPAQAALGVSAVTSSPFQTFNPEKSFTQSINCNSPRVISSISSYAHIYDGGSLQGLTASCATLAANGLTISAAGSQTLVPVSSGSGTLTTSTCSSGGGSKVLVGAKVYKTPVGFTAGVQLLCGTLPDGGSRSYEGVVIGRSTASIEE